MAIKVNSFTVQAKMKSDSESSKSTSATDPCGSDESGGSGGERSQDELIEECVSKVLERLNKEFDGRLI